MKDLQSNPFINSGFEKSKSNYAEDTMTISSTIIKTLVLIAVLFISLMLTWKVLSNGIKNFNSLLVISSIGAFILAIITNFVPKIAPITSIFYAVFEGVLLGSLSRLMEFRFPGVVLSAICLTIAVAISTLLIYRRTPTLAGKVRKGVVIATVSIALVYLISFLLGLFGINIPIFGLGFLGIGFSVFVVAIASISLILDYDFILRSVQYGSPKYMEWYAGFGLLVTLIWLYVEILELLVKLLQNNSEK